MARLKSFHEGEAPLAVTAPSKAGISATAMKSQSTPVVVKTAMKRGPHGKVKKARPRVTRWSKPYLFNPFLTRKNDKDLAFPGSMSFPAIKYGKCTVYADERGRRYRAKPDRASRRIIAFRYSTRLARDAWDACVAYLKKNA